MDHIFFTWGPFSVTSYSLFITLAVLIGLLIYYLEGERKGINPDNIIVFAVVALLGGIFGTRAAHIIFIDLDYYRSNPDQILSFQDGGLSFLGGLLGAMLFIIIYSSMVGLSMKRLMDAATPALTLGSAVARIGFITDGLPAPSWLPWAIEYNEKAIHPDQAYMIVLLYLLFILLWNKRTAIAYHGELFTWFIIGYGAISFFVDFFRIMPEFIWTLSLNQVGALALTLAGLLYAFAGKKAQTALFYQVEEESPVSKLKLLLQSFLFALFIFGSVLAHYSLH